MRSIASDQGLTGLFHAVRYQPGIRHVLEMLRPAYWRRWDNPVLGRWVELRGNVGHIEGCSFTLDHPSIPTRLKALFLFDRYEHEERELLRAHLDPSSSVLELGGSIGVVACVTNRRLHDPRRHVVVEANPALLDILEENRDRNGCRFTIVHRALAYDAAAVAFDACGDFLGGRVASERMTQGQTGETVLVAATTLAELLERFDLGPCTLVCDIEGAEGALVEREIETLRAHVRSIVLEVHESLLGVPETAAMLRRLERAGFVTLARFGSAVVLRRAVPRVRPRPVARRRRASLARPTAAVVV